MPTDPALFPKWRGIGAGTYAVSAHPVLYHYIYTYYLNLLGGNSG